MHNQITANQFRDAQAGKWNGMPNRTYSVCEKQNGLCTWVCKRVATYKLHLEGRLPPERDAQTPPAHLRDYFSTNSGTAKLINCAWSRSKMTCQHDLKCKIEVSTDRQGKSEYCSTIAELTETIGTFGFRMFRLSQRHARVCRCFSDQNYCGIACCTWFVTRDRSRAWQCWETVAATAKWSCYNWWWF